VSCPCGQSTPSFLAPFTPNPYTNTQTNKQCVITLVDSKCSKITLTFGLFRLESPRLPSNMKSGTYAVPYFLYVIFITLIGVRTYNIEFRVEKSIETTECLVDSTHSLCFQCHQSFVSCDHSLCATCHTNGECLLAGAPGRTAANFDAAVGGSLLAMHESMVPCIKTQKQKNAFFASSAAAAARNHGRTSARQCQL